MKKKPSNRGTSFVSVKLYRNDIEELLSLLSDYVYAIEISDDKNIYSDLNELQATCGDRIPSLSIEGTAMGTSFKLELARQSRSYLEVTNRDEVFLRVIDFLKAHRRTRLGVVIIASILAIVAITVLGAIRHTNFVWLLLLVVFPIILLKLWANGNLSLIYLMQKHKQESFWTRNKDTIWVGVIVAIVTAIVTWAITYFTTK